MAMITSAANPPWPLDCPIEDLSAAGLPAPSKVRFKLFTLDHRLVRGELGRLGAADEARVRQALANLLALSTQGRPGRRHGSQTTG
jgi:mRNA interferase MazF